MTDAEKQALEKSDAEWQEPDRMLIDEWNLACNHNCGRDAWECGRYNPTTGYCELNGLLDIPAKEAIDILRMSAWHCATVETAGGYYITPIYASPYPGWQKTNVRTYFPIRIPSYSGTGLIKTFMNNPQVEVLAIYNWYGDYGRTSWCRLIDTFWGCTNLREIRNEFTGIWEISANCFNGCTSLETVKLDLSLNYTPSFTVVDLHWSPNLSYESLRYMADKGGASADYTVKVHPDVYAKLQNEWNDILTDAAAKRITFATE